jgi:ribosomal protein S18
MFYRKFPSCNTGHLEIIHRQQRTYASDSSLTIVHIFRQMIRPHDLLYKSRRVTPPPPRRRPQVGPPPAQARYHDVFHQFHLDPLSQVTNPAILSQFLSEMGKIYSRSVTGLTLKTQRRLGKAIRRAKMMGIIPVLSTHKQLSGVYRNRR